MGFRYKSGTPGDSKPAHWDNELDAITICRGFVKAQHEYSEEKHDDAKVNRYAQKIISTPGKHDGLAWQTPMEHGAGQLAKDRQSS